MHRGADGPPSGLSQCPVHTPADGGSTTEGPGCWSGLSTLGWCPPRGEPGSWEEVVGGGGCKRRTPAEKGAMLLKVGTGGGWLPRFPGQQGYL